MRKEKQQQSENYLERHPLRASGLEWSADGEGMVTLAMENKGLMNRIAQRFFKKPRITHIHLDAMGSFVWPLLDGNRNIADIGVLVKEHFGEEAEPLYERLAKYFQILDSYSFVEWQTISK